jgi:gamma-glutamyl:cysteine ligase YbdK (ATP-grasp superfamily)
VSRFAERSPGLHLFEGAGIEIEYVLVDGSTFQVAPVADQVIATLAGRPTHEASFGTLACSNELALHVFELKTDAPASDLAPLPREFLRWIQRTNDAARATGARLMPGAMHPFMQPETQTRLWPHEQNEIYGEFDRLFGCSGHGWSNLQSMHINLPFQGNEEFGRLHTAIRVVLPLLPALAASSPFVEGRRTGLSDNRLHYYARNSKNIPSVAGEVVPEVACTRAEYEATILAPIARDLESRGAAEVLEPEWTNARGAIARFVRDSIEIRILDSQECATADLSVAALTIALVKALVEERWSSYETQRAAPQPMLVELLNSTIRDADRATVPAEYLSLFGFPSGALEAKRALRELITPLEIDAAWLPSLDVITTRGCLAHRLAGSVGEEVSHSALTSVVERLCDCLEHDQMFET